MFGQGFNSGFFGGPPCFTDTTDIFKDNSGVALYTLDYDASDSGNATGKFGEGAVFNGSSSKIELPSALSDGVTTDATCISFWFNVGAEVTSSTTSNEIMQFAGTSSLTGKIALGSTSGHMSGETFSVTSNVVGTYTYSQTNIPAGWNHAVVQWNSSDVKWDIYINAVKHTTYTVGTQAQRKFKLKFGNRSTSYYTGSLDQVRIFNTALSSLEVTTLYNETKNTTNTLQILGDTSCIATYPLDGSSTDLSGNYNGTDTNILYKYDGTPTNVDFGVGGKSLYGARFNGSSSYIYASSSVQQPTTNFSVSVWSKWNSKPSGSVGLVGNFKTGVTPQVGFVIAKPSGLNGFQFFADGTATNGSVQGTTNFITNRWYHVVGTYDGSNIKIYVDGQLEGTQAYTATPAATDQPLVIGRWYGNYSDYYFDGSIDQVRIFSKALSSAEVGKLYGNGAGEIACKYTATTTDIAYPIANTAYYKLDNDSKDSARSTGKFNEGAIFNGSSSYINTNYTLTGSTTFTWSAWINTSNTKNTYVAGDFNSAGSNSAHRFSVRIYSQVLQASVNNSAGGLGTTINFGTFAHYGSWAHLVVTIDGTTVKGYVNGSQLGSTGTSSQSLAAGANPLTLGMYGSGGTGITPFDGSIDQVRIYDTALDSTDVSNLYAETISDTNTLSFPPGKTAVATYQLDGNSTDLSGNYNGTDTNVTYAYDGTESNIEYSFGRYGQAAVFNGIASASRSKITTSGLTTYNNFSISFWANPDDVNNTRLIMGTSDGYSTQTGFGVFFGLTGNGNLTWRVSNGTSTVDMEKSSISTGNWHHIVITQNTSNNEKKLYVNGNLETTSTSTINATGQGYSLIIGGYNAYTNTPYDGDIDQVRIYSTALTSSQVTQLYNEKPEVDTSNFKTVLYEGNSSTQYISNVGMDLETNGGLVWLKQRNSAQNHGLFDTVRGVNSFLISNSTSNVNTRTTDTLSSFDANGFTLTPYSSDAFINYSGRTMVAWCWKGGGDAVPNTDGDITSQVSANTEAGFSIVKVNYGSGEYTQNVGHGLSQQPELIVSKHTDSSSDWFTFSEYGGSLLGTNNILKLNTSAAATSDSFFDISTSTFKTGYSTGAYNAIAYCFHSVAGYSKIGSYSGSGVSGKEVTLDFNPSFVLIKRTDNITGWVIVDEKRGTKELYAHLPNIEDTSTTSIVLGTNKFTLNTTGSWYNASSGNYLYMAFK